MLFWLIEAKMGNHYKSISLFSEGYYTHCVGVYIAPQFSKKQMPDDLLDANFESDAQDADDDSDGGELERITNVGPTDIWTVFCKHLAIAMWNE
ncbi:hypothetical protein Scep_021478 [Stephania cephalantha]|uniref:Uncharacterized protein n=1 Tax=Stephania cephalantha TaxID=152367 RepID=A0AAP0FDU8_9MAGN